MNPQVCHLCADTIHPGDVYYLLRSGARPAKTMAVCGSCYDRMESSGSLDDADILAWWHAPVVASPASENAVDAGGMTPDAAPIQRNEHVTLP